MNILNKFAFWKWHFFQKLIHFLFGVINDSWHGKLFVSGEGSSEFTFPNYPENILVYFEDDCDPSPCNPGTDDILNWYVKDDGCGHKLIIEWSVNGVRTISWKVC